MAALITFKVEVDMKTLLPSNKLLQEVQVYFKEKLGLTITTSDEACANKKVVEHIQECVNKTNTNVVSAAARIKKFALIPIDFSMPGGELTPTMKLKRNVTEEKHKAVVEAMYAPTAKI